MTDSSHSCPNPLVSGLVGGIIGAGVVAASRQRQDALLRDELQTIAALEHDRLTVEQQRHRLAQTEAIRHDTERAYQHAVLWLSHSNQEERLAYLLTQNRPALLQHLAERLTAEAELDPHTTALLLQYRQTRRQLTDAQQAHHARGKQLSAARRARWSAGSVFATGLLLVCIPGIPLLIGLGAATLPYLFLAVVLLGLLSPGITRWQRTPATYLRREPAPAPPGTFADFLSRETLLGTLRAREIRLLAEQSATQQAELRQQFRLLQPHWLAAAPRYVSTLHPLLEMAQQIYPPRVRCDLATVDDETIARHLHEPLAPVLAARCEHLLQT